MAGGPSGGARTVRVVPPRDDTAVALRLGLAIAVATFLGSSLSGGRESPRALLLPYQVPFDGLSPLEQAVAGEARLAIEEICRLRVHEGGWPPPARLEEELVPPFAALLLAGRVLEYRFVRELEDRRCSYLGMPGDGGDAPALLLRLEEAAGVADPVHAALVRADGLHRRLADGTVVHYSVWLRAAAGGDRIPARPELDGWRQMIPRRQDLAAGR